MSGTPTKSFKMVGMHQSSKYILSDKTMLSSQRLNIYPDRNTSIILEYDPQKLDEKQTAAIEREIDALSQIKHQNVLKLLNSFSENGRRYIVLQYCPLSLIQYIEKNKLCNESTAIKLIQQMLIAYKQLIDRKVYLNICPQNFLLTKEHKIKLAYFNKYNFSKQLKEDKNPSPHSHLFKSPQALKSQKYSSKSGIWSLGVIMYQLLFGKCPYNGSDQQQLANSIQNDSIDFSSGSVSEGCIQILKKMLQKDESQRIDIQQLLGLLQNNSNINSKPKSKSKSKSKSKPQYRLQPQLLPSRALQPVNPFDLMQNNSSMIDQDFSPIGRKNLISGVKYIVSNENIQPCLSPKILPSSFTSISVSPIKSIEGVLKGRKHTVASTQNFDSFEDLKKFHILPHGESTNDLKIETLSKSSISSEQESIIQAQTQFEHNLILKKQTNLTKVSSQNIFRQYNKNEQIQRGSSFWIHKLNISRQQVQKSRSKTKEKPTMNYSSKWTQKLNQLRYQRI